MKKVLLTIAIVAAGATMVLDAEQPTETTTTNVENTKPTESTITYDTILIQRQGQRPDTIIKAHINNVPASSIKGE